MDEELAVYQCFYSMWYTCSWNPLYHATNESRPRVVRGRLASLLWGMNP